MRFTSRIRPAVIDILDFYKMRIRRKNEIKKFEDPRRKAIYSAVELSNEQREEIDKLYIQNYGERIPYTWHRHFTAYTGRFDANYFPELLYIPEFEHFMNLKRDVYHALADKSVTSLLAKAVGIESPRIIVSATGGLLRDESFCQIDAGTAAAILRNIGEVFCKPSIDTSSGIGCRILDIRDGCDTISGERIEDILFDLGTDYLIQERVECHDSIKALHPNSVNTFRIMTYRWKDEIRTPPIIMRIGQGGSFLDNAHAGGMFIGVENNGQLHEAAFTEFKETYTVHPDSKIVFSNYRIPFVPQMIEAAKKMHMAYPDIGVVNWDFTINKKQDPLLIEANLSSGGIWLFEMAHGCGLFKENTPEVLRWMRVMKATKVLDRHRYMYGKNFE